MIYRINWKELTDKSSQLFHFKWRHVSYGRDFCNLAKSLAEIQVLNHFEYHPVISNKLNLFLNLMKFCEVIKRFFLKNIYFIKLIGSKYNFA